MHQHCRWVMQTTSAHGQHKLARNHGPQLVRQARGSLAALAGPHQHRSQQRRRGSRAEALVALRQGVDEPQGVLGNAGVIPKFMKKIYLNKKYYAMI